MKKEQQEWSVRVEGRTEKSDLDAEDLMVKLADYHPSVALGDGFLSATTTFTAVSVAQAVDLAVEVISGVAPWLDVDLVEAMTDERQDEEIEHSNLPDLVGIAEIAEMGATTRQRAFQITGNRGFPRPLLELASGRLWDRAAVRSYLDTPRRALHRTQPAQPRVSAK